MLCSTSKPLGKSILSGNFSFTIGKFLRSKRSRHIPPLPQQLVFVFLSFMACLLSSDWSIWISRQLSCSSKLRWERSKQASNQCSKKHHDYFENWKRNVTTNFFSLKKWEKTDPCRRVQSHRRTEVLTECRDLPISDTT